MKIHISDQTSLRICNSVAPPGKAYTLYNICKTKDLAILKCWLWSFTVVINGNEEMYQFNGRKMYVGNKSVLSFSKKVRKTFKIDFPSWKVVIRRHHVYVREFHRPSCNSAWSYLIHLLSFLFETCEMLNILYMMTPVTIIKKYMNIYKYIFIFIYFVKRVLGVHVRLLCEGNFR